MRFLLAICAAVMMVQSSNAQGIWRNYWTTNYNPFATANRVSGTLTNPIANAASNYFGTVQSTNILDPSNVKYWGAKGDGVTDDTAAIQAAFNSARRGGNVYVPLGFYKITSPILITNAVSLHVTADKAGISPGGEITGAWLCWGGSTNSAQYVLSITNTEYSSFTGLGVMCSNAVSGILVASDNNPNSYNITFDQLSIFRPFIGVHLLGSITGEEQVDNMRFSNIRVTEFSDRALITQSRNSTMNEFYGWGTTANNHTGTHYDLQSGAMTTLRNCMGAYGRVFVQRGYLHNQLTLDNCQWEASTNAARSYLESDAPVPQISPVVLRNCLIQYPITLTNIGMRILSEGCRWIESVHLAASSGSINWTSLGDSWETTNTINDAGAYNRITKLHSDGTTLVSGSDLKVQDSGWGIGGNIWGTSIYGGSVTASNNFASYGTSDLTLARAINFASGSSFDTLVATNGNVGIGTANPLAKLQINHGLNYSYPTAGTTRGSVHINPDGIDDHSAAITFGLNAGGTVWDNAQAGIYVQSANSYGSRMFLGVSTNVDVGAEARLTILGNGAIGIGKINPETTLDVAGDIRSSTTITATNGLLTLGTATASNFVHSTWKWIDILASGDSIASNPAGDPPVLTEVPGQNYFGYGYYFMDKSYFSVQGPHKLAMTNATNPQLYFQPHLHVSTTNVTAGTNASFGLELYYGAVHGYLTNYYASTNSATLTNTYGHYMINFGNVTNNALINRSSVVWRGRVMRVDGGGGDIGSSSPVWVDSIDLHIPVQEFGTIGQQGD